MRTFRSKISAFLSICYFLTWFVSAVRAEVPLRFDQLGRNEGLSQSSVNCMIRDSRGFMWFGTREGLNRYDGKKIRLFQNQPGDSASLSNNYVLSMCEDEEGFLWVGTMAGGLNRFNGKTGQFRVFSHADSTNSLSENTVWTVLADGRGHIWAGTSLGLNRYDTKTGKFHVFRHEPGDPVSLISDMVISLWMDSRGMLWTGTTEGLCMLDPETEKFTTYYNTAGKKNTKDANIIWSVGSTPSGKIVFGTNDGVYSLDTITGRFTEVLGSSGQDPLVVWSVFSENDRLLWAGTTRGLYRIHIVEGRYELFRNDPADMQSLADDNVWCIMSDPAGNLWIGTQNGVSKARAPAGGFRLLSADPGQRIRLSSSKVMSILEDRQGYLWIGTDGGGLNCIRPGIKEITVYNVNNSELRNDAVWALAEDREGNIWIGNYLGGLHVFKRSTGTIQALPLRPNDPRALHNNRVLALLPGENGEIWIGTRSGGLVRFDPQTGVFKNYLHSPDDTASITGNTVLSLAFDRNKRLWAGVHEGGLNLFDPETDKFISFRRNSPSGLSDDNVWAILFDKKGRLWLGTHGGLNYAKDPGPEMHLNYLGTQDGLSGNMVFGLLEDSLGNIWTSNFNGLSRLDIRVFESRNNPDPGKDEFEGPLFRIFDADQGLQGPEFNQGAFHKGPGGLLFFGGSNGLNYFFTGEIQESRFMPPVVITGFRVFNKDVFIRPSASESGQGKVRITEKGGNYFLPKEISFVSELLLSYRESVLSFDFASLDFSSPSKNQYAYKLSGFDKAWNFMGSQNTATYTNLNPGDYTLLIRGSNSDGIWNTEETRLKITIVPPFWKTWWFLSILAALTTIGVWSIFNDLKRKARKEKELIELQLKTIKSQIDPHFAFNALNTVASFIYAGEPDVTYDYFTRFAFMIRNILKDNDRISRTLHEEIEFVRNYLELQKVRFKDKFEYFIQVDEAIPPVIQVPKMIIQSYAENAVKHGLMHREKGGLLKISVEKKDPCILISVEDNGIGREKAAELNSGSTGLGLKMMDQIIGLYKKLFHTEITQTIEDLSDDNGNPAGTRVILTISLSRDRNRTNRFIRFNPKSTTYEN